MYSTSRPLIFLGLLVGSALVVAPMIAVGLPKSLAICLALLIVGAAAAAVGSRFSGYLAGQVALGGVAFMAIAGLFGISAVHHALPQVNGFLVFVVMLVLEIGALVGLVALYYGIRRKAAVAALHRLAQRRGWRYEPAAEVPVPGPNTAARLHSVPDDATSTTGRDVLYAVANGLSVTVFNRFSDSGIRRQTVWLVHLPMPLPYLEPAPYLAPPTDAERSDFGRAVLTDEVRRAARQQGFPSSWWIEGGYLCTIWDEGGAGDPAPVTTREEYVDRLTGLASRLPWPALHPYAPWGAPDFPDS